MRLTKKKSNHWFCQLCFSLKPTNSDFIIKKGRKETLNIFPICEKCLKELYILLKKKVKKKESILS